MRFVAALCVWLAAVAACARSVHAEDTDDALKLYAVHIYRTGHEEVFGNGVYLGRGVVLTAAHVAGLGIWRQPRVGIAGLMLPSGIIKDGHFHGIDLELLSIDETRLPVSLALRRMAVCRQPHWAGEDVVVATPEGVTTSKVMSPGQLPPGIAPQYRTAIRYVAGSGNSGSGVFDAYKKCLRGIITRRISRSEVVQDNGKPAVREMTVAKYFVPAAAIAGFISGSVRY
jgi:hypothetical protein